MKRQHNDQDLLIQDIINHTSEVVNHDRPILISIDGVGGTGKSTLARAIASITSSRVVSVDDYLIPYKGSYLPHLRYEDLENDLKAAETHHLQFVIIEGLCVLAVLERLHRQPDIAVYIRRVDEYGEWSDKFYYSEDNDLDEVLERLTEIDAHYPDMPGIGDKDRELVRYHIQKRPITHSQYVYDRARQPPSGGSASD